MDYTIPDPTTPSLTQWTKMPARAKCVGWLHPDGLGLACPRGGVRDGLVTHRRHRAPAPGYRGASCRRVFNVVTGAACSTWPGGPGTGVGWTTR